MLKELEQICFDQKQDLNIRNSVVGREQEVAVNLTTPLVQKTEQPPTVTMVTTWSGMEETLTLRL